MSAIDELKDGVIDLTTSSGKRTVEIDAIATESPVEEEEKIGRLEDELLNLDNPNSPFSNYVKEKTQEMQDFIAEKEEELAIDELEDENSNTTPGSASLVMDFTNEDIDDEDEVVSVDNSNVIDITGTSTTTMKPNVEINIDEKKATEDKKTDQPKKEKEYIDAPNIDLDVSVSNESYTTEIVEEDNVEVVTAEDNSEDTLKYLQKLATEKLKPVSKALDISSFTVLKKPVSNITPVFEAQKAKVSKWVLPSQESTVFMKEFSGSELEKLRLYTDESTRGVGSVDAMNRRYHMIYDHITSPKPTSFEQWLKTTPFDDIDHYFFAIYIASFNGANYLPADCIDPNCKETFLSDDIPIMDMVKFDTEEDKKKFMDLYKSEVTPAGKGVYCSEVVPISNRIAISFRQPSIYNLIEIRSLDNSTLNRFNSIIEYIPYIDTIYLIDMENQTLTPVTYKMYSDNANKTIKSKLQKYENIFNTLSVDEFGPIKAYIAAIASKAGSGIKYLYPALECPKCGNMTEEQVSTAEELVFTRYQLSALVSTSLS